MPIYEYKCTDCGRFEVEQSIKDEPLGSCPKCGERSSALSAATLTSSSKGPVFTLTTAAPTAVRVRRILLPRRSNTPIWDLPRLSWESPLLKVSPIFQEDTDCPCFVKGRVTSVMGVMSTFVISHNGLSAERGSGLVTSKPTPPIHPFSSASTKSPWGIKLPYPR